MSKSKIRLALIVLIVLIPTFLFYKDSCNNSEIPFSLYQKGTIFDDSIKTLRETSVRLQTTISPLKKQSNNLKDKDLKIKKQYIQKIKEIGALSPDRQISVFKSQTDSKEKEILKRINSKDILISIPLSNIISANLKFVELESAKDRIELLELSTANKDSLISAYEKLYSNQQLQTKTITACNENLKSIIKTKDAQLKKQRILNQLVMIAGGVIILIGILK